MVLVLLVVVVLACLRVALTRGLRHEAWPCGVQCQQGTLDHLIVQGVDELLRLSGDERGVMKQGEGEKEEGEGCGSHALLSEILRCSTYEQHTRAGSGGE